MPTFMVLSLFLMVAVTPAGSGTEQSASLPASPLAERPLAQWRMPGSSPVPATGKLLVASPGMKDPNFAETVVLLIACDAGGALGLVLNRRTEVGLSRILPDVERLKERDEPVYLGGPVDRTRMYLLVRSEEKPNMARPVLDGVYVGENAKLLDRLLEDGNETEFRAFAGYAGWGAGQLEGEIASGGWHVVAGTAERVFSERPRQLWRSLLPRNGMEWTRLISVGEN